MTLTPSPLLKGLTPPMPRRKVAIDLPLDGNEGAVPTTELYTELLTRGAGPLHRYPDAHELEAVLGKRLGVGPDQVLVTAGADEALDRVCRALLGPGREIVLPVPTFEMLHRYPVLADGEIVRVNWSPEAPYPIDAVLAAITPKTAIVAIVSPNNPTGATARFSDLKRLSIAAPHALLLVDLAYAEFTDQDLTDDALWIPNALVLRTLSKAYGLAGLRVGYCAGSAEVIRWLRTAGAPFSVSGPSLALALAALERGDAAMRRSVARVREERDQLFDLMRELGGTAYRSQANFVLVRHRKSVWIEDALAGLGISVRSFPHREELAQALRITCPCDERGYARLAAGLRTALHPEALLFDYGGVIALANAALQPRKALLLRLAEKLPLAIVADRPRAEVDRFVAQHGLETIFSEIVAHEDAPLGPKSVLVQRALEKVHREHAWLVGDTPDDLVAAREARVVPIGFAPAGAEHDAARAALQAGGAARILDDFEQLEALLR